MPRYEEPTPEEWAAAVTKVKGLYNAANFDLLARVARDLAEAIRSHGPWMDERCEAALAQYDAWRQTNDNPD